jgi:hypothetical protein
MKTTTQAISETERHTRLLATLLVQIRFLVEAGIYLIGFGMIWTISAIMDLRWSGVLVTALSGLYFIYKTNRLANRTKDLIQRINK